MKRVKNDAEASLEVKGSRFIAWLTPSHRYETLHKELREIHPKASHIVSAYRYFNEREQIVEAGSDDGEPRGCAGLPVLNVLRGNELIDTALLVVRYFGGTKLGTGGMARAYTLAAKRVIEVAQLAEYRSMLTLEFETDYSSVRRIDSILSRLAVEEIRRDFLSRKVNWKIDIDQEILERFRGMSSGYITILE
jgi:uncharacterized YigZ family protein